MATEWASIVNTTVKSYLDNHAGQAMRQSAIQWFNAQLPAGWRVGTLNINRDVRRRRIEMTVVITTRRHDVGMNDGDFELTESTEYEDAQLRSAMDTAGIIQKLLKKMLPEAQILAALQE